MKKLRILHVTLYMDIGGLEKLIFDMGKFFVEQGHEVEILCLRAVSADYLENINSCNIPVHLMRKKNRMDLGFHYRAARCIRAKSFDVIHAHSGCLWDGALFCLLAGVEKYIYTAHGMPYKEGLKGRGENILAGFIVDHLVGVSDEVAQQMRQTLPFNQRKVRTIINGINTDVFVPLNSEQEKKALLDKYNLPHDHVFVGTVGRFAPEKNYQMLLHAFALFIQENELKVDLLLVGAGRVEEELRTLVAALGIEHRVHFMGIQHDIYEILPLLTVFVLSSLTEGTSISLLEAQACGIPAVVTDVGGNGFVVKDGENGLLCQVDNAAEMSSCFHKMFEQQGLASLCGKNARKRVEDHFSFKSMIHQYEQLYRG